MTSSRLSSRAKLTFATLAVAAGSLAGPADAQSFNCRAASVSAERAVCASDKLSALDERMSRLYDKLMGALDRDDQREGLRDYQLRFLASRDACGRNENCIKGAYLDQISVLSQRIRYADNRWDQ